MKNCWLTSISAVFCLNFYQVQGQTALTVEELAILRTNNFTVTVHNDSITLAHHGLPEHTAEGGWGNPNDAIVVNHEYTLPLRATISEPKGCAGGLGVIGLAVSGGAFYNPYTAFGKDAVEGDCKEDLDSCEGHPSPDGMYHYHGVPHCLYTGDLRDKFFGVALDGYPIYGPMDATGKNWTTADLDQCHGHYYNGRYMYRATYQFPYILSCYHGNSVKVNPQQQPPPGGQGGTGTGPLPPLPPGAENDPCWNAEVENWSALTCIVVCGDAGTDLSNCASPSRYNSSATTKGPTGGSSIPTFFVSNTKGLLFVIFLTHTSVLNMHI